MNIEKKINNYLEKKVIVTVNSGAKYSGIVYDIKGKNGYIKIHKMAIWGRDGNWKASPKYNNVGNIPLTSIKNIEEVDRLPSIMDKI